MRYEFLCDDCQVVQEVTASITDGPPALVACPECEKKMYQDFGGNFILLGGGWPGKEIKEGKDYHLRRVARSQDEEREHEREVAENEAEEVMAIRRQGKRASEAHRSRNKPLWTRYAANLRKGVGTKAGKKKI